MKKNIIHFPKIVIINLILFVIGLVLIQFDIINSGSVLGHLIGYILPVTLIVNSIFVFFLIREKEFKKVENNIINTLKISVISCLIFISLVRFEFVNSILGYVYLYVIFPYTALIFLIFSLILIKQQEISILKKMAIKFIIWIIILILFLKISEELFK